MEAVLQQLFLKGNAQNLFIVRCDDEDTNKKLQAAQLVCGIAKQRGVPVKEVMEWDTSAELAKKWDAEEAQALKAVEKNDDEESSETNITTTTLVVGANAKSAHSIHAKDPITIAWGQLCKRKLWILCPFGSCSDEKLLRSAAVEILCARTFECHTDFRIILLCNRREFDRFPRVVRVLSGLKFGAHRYAVIPRVYQPECIEEPMEEYLNYDNIELAADAPELANFQEQVFNSDPLIRIVRYDSKRFGRGDLFIRIMRDALKFNLTVHTLDLSKSGAGDIICHCLTSILHTTRKLHHLVLSECSLTDAGIVELAAALRKNDAIWTLNISKNPQITDVGIVALASIFSPGTKSRLEGLDISQNNAIYDTPKQWSRAALIALWETLPRHPFLKYVSIAGCSLGSHHFVDLCDRWLGRYRRVTFDEWQRENDPDVDYHTAAIRRKQQKARRLKLQREQQKAEKMLREAEAERRRKEGLATSIEEADSGLEGPALSDAAKAYNDAAEELEQLEEEFLEPWELQKRQEEKEAEMERIRLENENKLFDSGLVSLNVSENTIGDAAIGLLMESLPMGLKRLNLEHVSMGAAGFRAVAFALSELHLTIEEVNLSHNNSLMLTRRLLMDAEGDDDFLLTEGEERDEARRLRQKKLKEEEADVGEVMVDQSVSSSPQRRRNVALSAHGEPLIFHPPALELSDWARFYVPPPKRRLTATDKPTLVAGGEQSQKQRPSIRQSVPADTKELFSSLISPSMVAILQADALYQSIKVDGWTFPPVKKVEEVAEKQQSSVENTNNPETNSEVKAVGNSANTPFFQQEDPDRIVVSTLSAAPRDTAIVALMKALEDNFRLHTLNLSATLMGDDGLRVLCDAIVAARCGVRSLDVSFNGNIGEESSHKVKELLVGSIFMSNQLKVTENDEFKDEYATVDATRKSSESPAFGDAEGPLIAAAPDGAPSNAGPSSKPPRPLNPANIHLHNNIVSSEKAPNGSHSPTSPNSLPLPSALANPDRPPSSPTAGHHKRVTTPTIGDNSALGESGVRASRAGRIGGGGGSLGGGGGGNSPSTSSHGAPRPDSNGDTASLNSTVVNSIGGGSSASSMGATLSTISSFFQDVEGNTIDTDIGVMMYLNLAGNTTTVGERALLALYQNAGLQVLDLRSMGITDGMLQPLADTCDSTLRVSDEEAAENAKRNAVNRPKKRLQLMMPKDSRRGSFDSCDYYDYDSDGEVIAPKLKIAHPIQNYFNPELSITKLYLGGHNTIWRAGIKHIAAFIKNSSTLQELHLDGLWSHFVDDLGQETSLSRTKREGLFFMEPLLGALSGGMYNCELLKTFSTASSMASGAAVAGRGAAAATSLQHKRSGGNTLAAIAARRSGNSSSMTSFSVPATPVAKGVDSRVASSGGVLPSALKGGGASQQNVGPLGTPSASVQVPTNYRAPTLRLLNLSKNDLAPIVVSELLIAISGNEYLTMVNLSGNPLLERCNCDDAKLVDALEADERFIL